MTTVYPNKIPIEKRVILHKNKAMTLISFNHDNPEDVKDWVQRGQAPELWDPESWAIVEHTKWKAEIDDEGGISAIEAMDLC
jgi:hypothetical protein